MHAFDVLGDTVRRRILELLADGELAAGAITETIQREYGISQPAVSQHLRVLREHGFATVRVDGSASRLLGRIRRPTGGRRVARSIPAGVDTTTRRAGNRARAWQTEEAAMIDVIHQINAVRRHVGSRVLEVGEARVVTISQSYDAGIDDVWDACTNAERIPRWFLPISGDLRLHGAYQLEGNAGGTITACDPPTSFAATWEYDGDVSWIEVRLTPEADERTRFELEHVAHVDDERWTEFGPGAVGVGWDLAFIGLTLHLASGQPVDPAEVAAWSASDAGKQFMTLSSEGWRDASIAGGADPAAARAAADRTTAAYTGEE